MNELKTLKDIEMPSLVYESGYIQIDQLRQEAIKWIEILEKNDGLDLPKDKKLHPFFECVNTYEGGYSSNNLIQWIKHFFNITDENLK